MNTPNWVFSTLSIGPYEKFHQKNIFHFVKFLDMDKKSHVGKPNKDKFVP
jgi:hypothetical protein